MHIDKCFKVLELDPAASLGDATQAYRDLVSIWHPDRFSDNPRLRKRGEEKLKEINQAYGAIKVYLGGGRTEPPKGSRGYAEKRDPAEVIAETGTIMFLNACSFVCRTFRSLVDGSASKAEGEGGDSFSRGK